MRLSSIEVDFCYVRHPFDSISTVFLLRKSSKLICTILQQTYMKHNLLILGYKGIPARSSSREVILKLTRTLLGQTYNCKKKLFCHNKDHIQLNLYSTNVVHIATLTISIFLQQSTSAQVHASSGFSNIEQANIIYCTKY